MRVPSLKHVAASLAIVTLAACQTAPSSTTSLVAVRPAPLPAAAAAQTPSPVLTSLLARNFGAYDAGVFAVMEDGKAIWLTNVPAGGTRSIPIVAHHLQANGLVLRVHPIGSGRTWTSGATLVDGQTIGVLDVAADRVGNPVATVLRFVPTSAYAAEFRQ